MMRRIRYAARLICDRENDAMPSELQSLEEILKYYLSSECEPTQYRDLADAVTRIQNAGIRTKMEALLRGASNIRRNEWFSCDDYEDIVLACTVKPPTERLGELYDDDRLARVLEGMDDGTELPPVKVKYAPQGDSFDYEVVDGIHRYYASVKRGYAKIPVQLAG
jgi:hypothetical protein